MPRWHSLCALVAVSSLWSAGTVIGPAADRDSTALVVTAPGATIRVDASSPVSRDAGPLTIDAPDVTVIVDADTVFDGTDAPHPFLVATGNARGLRLVSSHEGRAARIVGFVGGVEAIAASGCSVRDLEIRVSGGDGVALGPGARVEGVLVEACLGDGIRVGQRSSLSSSRALGNAGTGVHAGDGSQVVSVISGNNGADGFVFGRGCVGRSVTAVANAGSGIVASYSAMIEASVAESNSVDGVRVDDGSTVYATVANDNGDSGIRTGSGSAVIGGSARSNVRVGYDLAPGTLLTEAVASNGFVGVLARADARTGSVLVVGNAHGVVTLDVAPSLVLSEQSVVRSSSVADVGMWSQNDAAIRLARD